MSNPKLKVMVIIPHYWGRGDTLREAWNNVKKESCKTLREMKRGQYKVCIVPESDEFKAYVDAMGTMHWADVEGIAQLVIEEGK